MTENEGLFSQETISSYFRMLDLYIAEIAKSERKIQHIMELLQRDAGKTFIHEGQIYQVCQKKKDGTFFFRELDKWPKNWLDREARRARNSPPGLTEPENTVQADVVQEDCSPSVHSSGTLETLPEGLGVSVE